MKMHDLVDTQYGYAHFPQQTASDATNYWASWVAPFALTITGIDYVPSDAITGANTNTNHINVDALAAGTEIANIDFVSGTDGAAGVASALTLTATTADLNLAAGAVVRVEVEEVGTGLGTALPAGVIVFKYRGN